MFPLYVRVTEVTGGETKREILSGSKTAVFLRRTPRNLTSDLCSRFQDVKEYADELEMVFRALLDVREVSPTHTMTRGGEGRGGEGSPVHTVSPTHTVTRGGRRGGEGRGGEPSTHCGYILVLVRATV